MAGRTDVPVTGLYSLTRDMETLDLLIRRGDIDSVHFVRTFLLGMMSKLDASITAINES